MKLIYIDEAGNTGSNPDPDQPFHMLGALIVDEQQVRPTEAAIRAVTHKYLPDAWFIPDFELHGHHIRGGKGTFKVLKPDQRIALATDLLNLLLTHNISFGYVAIDKQKLANLTSRHPHEVAFQFLVERVQDVLAADGSLGLLIADEQDEVEERLITNLDHYKQYRTDWGYRRVAIDNIVDSIHFVKSRNNRLIQLADVATFFANKEMRINSSLWADWLASMPRPTDYKAWRDSALSPAQRADLALAGRIVLRRFSKTYPQ